MVEVDTALVEYQSGVTPSMVNGRGQVVVDHRGVVHPVADAETRDRGG